MIELERSKDNKWIFQKNISSNKLIKSYVEVVYDTKDFDKEQIQEKLREKNSIYWKNLYGVFKYNGC